jgi:hypothetical protein
LTPLTVSTTEVLDRINVPEIAPEQLVFPETSDVSGSIEKPIPQRVPVLCQVEFAVSFRAHLGKLTVVDHWNGHCDHNESSEHKKP